MENKIFYLCDGNVPKCTKTHCYKQTNDDTCRHTSDIAHAINFEKMKGGYYREKENGKTWQEECDEKSSTISKTHDTVEQKPTDLP